MFLNGLLAKNSHEKKPGNLLIPHQMSCPSENKALPKLNSKADINLSAWICINRNMGVLCEVWNVTNVEFAFRILKLVVRFCLSIGPSLNVGDQGGLRLMLQMDWLKEPQKKWMHSFSPFVCRCGRGGYSGRSCFRRGLPGRDRRSWWQHLCRILRHSYHHHCRCRLHGWRFLRSSWT